MGKAGRCWAGECWRGGRSCFQQAKRKYMPCSICQLNPFSGNICAPQYTDLVSLGQEEPKILDYFCGACFRRARPRDVCCPCNENAERVLGVDTFIPSTFLFRLCFFPKYPQFARSRQPNPRGPQPRGRITNPARGPGLPPTMPYGQGYGERPRDVPRGCAPYGNVIYEVHIHIYLFISTRSSPSEAAMPKVAYVFFHHIHVILGFTDNHGSREVSGLLQRSR